MDIIIPLIRNATAPYVATTGAIDNYNPIPTIILLIALILLITLICYMYNADKY
jgi:hypothetical protein